MFAQQTDGNRTPADAAVFAATNSSLRPAAVITAADYSDARHVPGICKCFKYLGSVKIQVPTNGPIK